MPFPVDATHVRGAETKLGVTFPLGFVARMTRDNGGELSIEGETWWLHPFLDASDRTRLKRTCNDIVRETHEARKWPTFPPGGIAIASNGMGDQLALLPTPEEPRVLSAAVYMWSHETGEMDKVADDFSELVESPA